MEDDVFDLKFVFMVGVMLGQVPELLSQMKTVLGQFWTDEIFSNFNTIMQVSDLGLDKNISLENQLKVSQYILT